MSIDEKCKQCGWVLATHCLRCGESEQPVSEEIVNLRATLNRFFEELQKERGFSGICSAHQTGENKSCQICYPNHQPVGISGGDDEMRLYKMAQELIFMCSSHSPHDGALTDKVMHFLSMGEGSRLRTENSPVCLSDTPTTLPDSLRKVAADLAYERFPDQTCTTGAKVDLGQTRYGYISGYIDAALYTERESRDDAGCCHCACMRCESLREQRRRG